MGRMVGDGVGEALRAIHERAAKQHGVISLAQALELGLNRSSVQRRTASGAFEGLRPGVYRVSGSPTSWEQELVAACLWTGGVASHRAAGRLWGFDGLQRYGELEISITPPRHPRAPDVRIHRVTA